MNHIYRLVWSSLTGAWVAAAENSRARGKAGTVLRTTAPRDSQAESMDEGAVLHLPLLSLAIACLLALPAHALDAGALPTGAKVTAGSASVSSSGNTLQVLQNSQRAALDWQSFQIGAGATVNFVQPNSSAVALNRILGSDASQIYGHLNANGQVFFSNPNGMLFAPGSQVNVGGMLATTLGIGNDDFMAGNYLFSNAACAGADFHCTESRGIQHCMVSYIFEGCFIEKILRKLFHLHFGLNNWSKITLT